MANDPDERPPELQKVLAKLNAPPCWGHHDNRNCVNQGFIFRGCPFQNSCKGRTATSHMYKYERGLIDKSTAKELIANKPIEKKEDPDYEKRQAEIARLKKLRLEHLKREGE